MKTETPRTNRFYASFADGECIPNQDEWLALCESLETELTTITEQRDRLLDQQEQWRLSSVCRELTEQRDRLAEALEKTLNATVLNHRRDRWHIDAEHTIQLIKNQSTTNPNEP